MLSDSFSVNCKLRLIMILLLTENINFFTCSDHIALVKAFEGYKDAKRNGRERAFCWENFLSPVTLQMMEDMRNQFIDLLSGIGFVDKSRGASVSSVLSNFLVMHEHFLHPSPSGGTSFFKFSYFYTSHFQELMAILDL